MSNDYLIRYTSRSTVNDEPVGDVYVVRVADTIPGYPDREVFTYTKDPAEATVFNENETHRLLPKWQGAAPVSPSRATVLS